MIAGDENAALFVALADELELQMSGIRLQWQVAELIDQQKLRFGEVGELIREPVLIEPIRQQPVLS